jgi:hypothetical protein
MGCVQRANDFFMTQMNIRNLSGPRSGVQHKAGDCEKVWPPREKFLLDLGMEYITQ